MIRKKVICGLILTICIFVVCLVGCAPKKFNAFRNSIIKFGDYSSKNHQYEVVLKMPNVHQQYTIMTKMNV